MYGRPVISQEWSVHAQLTISHHQPTSGMVSDIPSQPTATSSSHHDSGDVHMEYSWGDHPTSPSPAAVSNSSSIPQRTCYGFQRGNILFTTRPPPRETEAVTHSTNVPPQATGTVHHPLGGRTHLLDSGYSSEQISPGSYGSLPTRKPAQPYNRRCKSTCSIVLSGSEHQGVTSASMRPNVENCGTYERDSANNLCYPTEHKCGDPVCYHQSTPQSSAKLVNRPISSDFAPVPETCEVCGGGRSPTAIRRASGSNTFTTHFCTHVPERTSKENKDLDNEVSTKLSRDAASQTSDHMPSRSNPSQPKMGNKVVYGAFRRKTDSVLLQPPEINITESDTESKKSVTNKRLSRSPAHRLSRSPAKLRGQSPLMSGGGQKPKGFHQNKATQDCKNQHKPRTVHIDVYCTGSEDADASGSSDDTDQSNSWSSPQTVFESEKLRVVHTRIGKDKLPVGYIHRQQQLQHEQQAKEENVSNSISRRSESFKYETARTAEEQQQQHITRGYDSDDGLSSHYPSQMSSCSTIREPTEVSVSHSEITSSTTSRDPSWSTISTSSIALSDEYDSAAATSWKDTATDLESLVQSSLSLAQSDSFEYADSADRLRIREKERAWAGTDHKDDNSKTWKSPQVERKHLLQQQKFKEFLEKHLGKSSFPLWKPETEDSDDDDETGDAWSFCDRDIQATLHSGGSTLKREDTVKRVTSEKDKDSIKESMTTKHSPHLKPPNHDSGSLSDSGPHRFICRTNIGPFGSKSPSPPPTKISSSVTSPFTNIPGIKTDQLYKAEKFGTIVGAFRKPGHHVGPSKNPECACEHCRRYYQQIGYRPRTHSVGDVPSEDNKENWKCDKKSESLNSSNQKVISLDSDLESSSITEDASTDNENR